MSIMDSGTDPVRRMPVDEVLIAPQVTDLEAWSLGGHLLGTDSDADPHILRGLD
jgi:hypothetical protein